MEEQAERKVQYADRVELETEILKKFSQAAVPIEFEKDFDESDMPISKKRVPKTKFAKRHCEPK